MVGQKHKTWKPKPLLLDPRLIREIRKRKGPYESWNACMARHFKITKQDLEITEEEELRWVTIENERRKKLAEQGEGRGDTAPEHVQPLDQD